MKLGATDPSETYKYVYDGSGNITSETNSRGESKYTYDGNNQLTKEELHGGITNTYTYTVGVGIVGSIGCGYGGSITFMVVYDGSRAGIMVSVSYGGGSPTIGLTGSGMFNWGVSSIYWLKKFSNVIGISAGTGLTVGGDVTLNSKGQIIGIQLNIGPKAQIPLEVHGGKSYSILYVFPSWNQIKNLFYKLRYRW